MEKRCKICNKPINETPWIISSGTPIGEHLGIKSKAQIHDSCYKKEIEKLSK